MPDLNTLLIGTVSVMMLVFIVTEIAKGLGLPQKYWRWFAGAVSVALASVPLYILPAYPGLEYGFTIFATLVMIFAGATGIYEVQK